MFELVVLVAQTAAVFFLAAWLSTGFIENVVHPDLNETFTNQVLTMERMREEYPEAYEVVAHRRIQNPAMQKFLFKLIVCWEGIATLTLWAGVLWLILAIMGVVDPASARAIGVLGVLLFTATWAGFLIVGNWFCYWFCHEGAQNTHYQMTLWGMATIILLVVA
ncbi:DUF2165 family protein [Ruegeria arenilitoris]|uniref:DUF2165 family protein n=1 Tax=Ruegeria arenilitoris TaxID=1173585 RepID=UPI00147F818A|nr:DUF2165 family protein [Ruegeria arenilitoris]